MMRHDAKQADADLLPTDLSPLNDTERGDRGGTTDAVYERLFQLAHHLGPNAKMPTVRRLREQFGVSQSTLDAALDRLESQRILQRRERSGIYVASRLGERNVCLLCSSHFFLQNSTSPFWSLLVEHIREYARARAIRLSIAFIEEPSTEKDEEEDPPPRAEDSKPLPDWLREDILSGKVQGVLAINLPRSLARWIERRSVPVVSYAGASRFIIGQANTTLVQLGVAALARHGCQKISFWSPFSVSNSPEAAESYSIDLVPIFAGALAAHALPFCAEDILLHNAAEGQTARSNVEIGWNMALRRFGPNTDPKFWPDAVVSQDDMLTQGMLMAFPQFGIQLGRDIQVATHANKGSPALLGWEDQLFRIEYDLDEFVDALFGTLETLLGSAGKTDAPVPEHFRVMHPRLILPLEKS